jgi:hypothetical protein
MATLGIAWPIIGIAAKDDAALVRLADIAMQGLGHNHAVDHRLDAFGDHGLQGL